MSQDVCRLCLCPDKLLWVFDKTIEASESIIEMIHITTGVKVCIDIIRGAVNVE